MNYDQVFTIHVFKRLASAIALIMNNTALFPQYTDKQAHVLIQFIKQFRSLRILFGMRAPAGQHPLATMPARDGPPESGSGP